MSSLPSSMSSASFFPVPTATPVFNPEPPRPTADSNVQPDSERNESWVFLIVVLSLVFSTVAVLTGLTYYTRRMAVRRLSRIATNGGEAKGHMKTIQKSLISHPHIFSNANGRSERRTSKGSQIISSDVHQISVDVPEPQYLREHDVDSIDSRSDAADSASISISSSIQVRLSVNSMDTLNSSSSAGTKRSSWTSSQDNIPIPPKSAGRLRRTNDRNRLDTVLEDQEIHRFNSLSRPPTDRQMSSSPNVSSADIPVHDNERRPSISSTSSTISISTPGALAAKTSGLSSPEAAYIRQLASQATTPMLTNIVVHGPRIVNSQFSASQNDEIDLRLGDVVSILAVYTDGWVYGMFQFTESESNIYACFR
ncbi:hypothetical protein BKA69DRAFT_1037927 [Paraphysoderma sedebokerense]|nr:hypothetical protein BKA69DRAFT_1037927 [Paraphysoderma sedebokerense]